MIQGRTILILQIMRWFARIMAILFSLFSVVLIISFVDHISQTKDTTGYLIIIITLILLVISYSMAFFNEKLGGATGLFFSVILIIISNPHWIIIFYPAISILFLIIWIISSIHKETNNEM